MVPRLTSPGIIGNPEMENKTFRPGGKIIGIFISHNQDGFVSQFQQLEPSSRGQLISQGTTCRIMLHPGNEHYQQ